MTCQSDPRFRSAAIFAADGKALKKVIQPKLKTLGWKSPGGWRALEHRMCRCAPPPVDFTPWTQPGGLIREIDIRAEVSAPGDCQATADAAIDFIGEQFDGLNRSSLRVGLQKGCAVNIGTEKEGGGFLTISFYEGCQSIWLPSAHLLEPWLGCVTCQYGNCPSRRTMEAGDWTIDGLRAILGAFPRYSVEFGGVNRKQFARACDALKREVAGKVTRAGHSVAIDYTRRDEVFPLVTQRVPGYLETAFFGGYAKDFDPYARPAAADAGETVRYPLVTCKRPHLNEDGEKDLDIDIVHRPQGDCYFDIQAFSYHPPDDQFVHNTLAEAIASLDVKAEIWDGDPFLRWH
jgi:hypothetical protein